MSNWSPEAYFKGKLAADRREADSAKERASEC